MHSDTETDNDNDTETETANKVLEQPIYRIRSSNNKNAKQEAKLYVISIWKISETKRKQTTSKTITKNENENEKLKLKTDQLIQKQTKHDIGEILKTAGIIPSK